MEAALAEMNLEEVDKDADDDQDFENLNGEMLPATIYVSIQLKKPLSSSQTKKMSLGRTSRAQTKKQTPRLLKLPNGKRLRTSGKPGKFVRPAEPMITLD